MSFRNDSDKSIAFLEPLGSHSDHINNLTAFDENVFEQDAAHFDLQFLRYSQILDTDYDNYIVLYTC